MELDKLRITDMYGDSFCIHMTNGRAYTAQDQYSVELYRMDMRRLRDWLTEALNETGEGR